MDKQAFERLIDQLSAETLSDLDRAMGGRDAFEAWCLERTFSDASLLKLFGTVMDKLSPLYLRAGRNHTVELIYGEYPIGPMSVLRRASKYQGYGRRISPEVSLQSFHHRNQKYYCVSLTQAALGDVIGSSLDSTTIFDLEDMFQTVFGPQLQVALLALSMFDRSPSLTFAGGLDSEDPFEALTCAEVTH